MKSDPKKDKVLLKPQYFHFRTKEGRSVSCHGGATVCYLPSKNGGVFGVSVCAPFDTFEKEIGRNKAMGNAIRNQLGKVKEFISEPMTMNSAHKKAESFVRAMVKRIMKRHENNLKEIHAAEYKYMSREVKRMNEMSCLWKKKQKIKTRSKACVPA